MLILQFATKKEREKLYDLIKYFTNMKNMDYTKCYFHKTEKFSYK